MTEIQALPNERVSMTWEQYQAMTALVKQLGEALGKAHHAIHYQSEVSNAEYAGIAAASEAYNNYLRERGE